MSVESQSPRLTSNEIVITGLGVVTCLGLDVDSIWQRVCRGESGIGPMPALESPLPPGKDGGQAADLPAEFWPELPREARYLRWAVDAALRDASIDLNAIAAPRVALMLGTTLHGMRAGGEFLRTGDHAKLRSFLAGDTTRLATIGLPIDGLRATTCSACSSSLGAIAMGVTLLERGEADLVIAGGYDAVSEYAYGGFAALRLVSDPPLRPFAKGRAGMKVAEGYGITVLERRREAEARGAMPRVVIAGWGESADAYHLTRPHPDGAGALAAMRQAITRAGIAPSDLDLIAAHATGTPDNDSSEAAAIIALLGDRSREVPVVGFKSGLGHTLGGAGAVELALSAMAIRDGILPPTANPAEVEYDAIRVTRDARRSPVRHTLNTSLGFGGANTCVVLRAPAPALDTPAEGAGDVVNELGLPDSCDVVITGVGVLVPGAIGNDAFAALVRDPRPTDRLTIDDAAYESIVTNARRLRRMSTYVKLSIAAATIAARDATLLAAPALLRDCGAILGTMHGSAGFCYDYYTQIVREGLAAANPVLFAEGVPNAAAAQLSLTLGLTGACQTILGTRTAGLDALRLAALRIANGDAERIIVCASEESHTVLDDAYAAVCADPPRSVSLAVAFVLEQRQSAERRGAAIRATIGHGTSVTALPGEDERALLRRITSNQTVGRIARSPVDFGNRGTFSAEPLLVLAAELLGEAPASDAVTLRAAGDGHIAVLNVRANTPAVR